MLMSVPQLNLLEWDQIPKAPDALPLGMEVLPCVDLEFR